MENTSDSFMPGSLLFCMKSKKSVCYSVADNNIDFNTSASMILHLQFSAISDADFIYSHSPLDRFSLINDVVPTREFKWEIMPEFARPTTSFTASFG